MKQFKNLVISILLFSAATAFSTTAIAENLINHSSNVFNFQQKLANKGNVLAQFKLASMYETGEGVEQSIKQAQNWYRRAAQSGNKAAGQRSVYLEIKQNGFDKTKHTAWLEGVKSDASKGTVEANYLLGQLYHEGVGVSKNLKKSLTLLHRVQMMDYKDLEIEIATIENEINNNRLAIIAKKRKNSIDAARLKQARIQQQQIEQKALRAKQAEAHRLSKAEKRRKYEAVMAKLKLEQQLIDQQQANVSGEAVASLDDEF